jgi:hypothetical protein
MNDWCAKRATTLEERVRKEKEESERERAEGRREEGKEKGFSETVSQQLSLRVTPFGRGILPLAPSV